MAAAFDPISEIDCHICPASLSVPFVIHHTKEKSTHQHPTFLEDNITHKGNLYFARNDHARRRVL